ncbi:hypothetical protein D3C87_1682500 [compost metagenome]
MSTVVTDPPLVTVLPAREMEAGRLIVGLPATPSPFVTVISLAVPVIVLAEPVPVPVRAHRPFVTLAARAARSESNACTSVPITTPMAVRAAAELAAMKTASPTAVEPRLAR